MCYNKSSLNSDFEQKIKNYFEFHILNNNDINGLLSYKNGT